MAVSIQSQARLASKATMHSRALTQGRAYLLHSETSSKQFEDKPDTSNSSAGMRRDVELAKGLSAVGIQGRLYTGIATIAFVYICMGILILVQLGAFPDIVQGSEGASQALTDNIISSTDQIRLITLIILALGTATAAAAAVFIARSIVKPITVLSQVTERMARGQYDLSVPYMESLDEVGQIARSVKVFRDNAVENLAAESRRAEEERQLMEDVTNQIVSRFRTFFDEVFVKVHASASHMKEVSGVLQKSSRHTIKKVTSFRESTQEQFDLVNSVNESVQNLTGAIQEISGSARIVSTQCGQADERVKDTSVVFQKLEDVTKRISEIIGVISDIAEKTNLLALNASIEAARAGEAGKGFSVVAGEVKSLANQTSQSSNSVGDLINEIQAVARNAVSEAEKISESVTDINKEISKVAISVEQQSAVSSNISADVEQVSHITNDFVGNLGQIAEVFETTNEAVETMANKSDDLQSQINSLRVDMEAFLEKVLATDLETEHDSTDSADDNKPDSPPARAIH